MLKTDTRSKMNKTAALFAAEQPAGPDRQEVYELLMKASRGLVNDHVLACMLASQSASEGDMPHGLGLAARDYDKMMAAHFPVVQLPRSRMPGNAKFIAREDEFDELLTLISSHGIDGSAETSRMATLTAVGCMGGNHLWQDMGLWSRKDLSFLIQANFPELKVKNDKDMKWKKFFYKQLCMAEGIYVCRSPSCEVCPDYNDCFTVEE